MVFDRYGYGPAAFLYDELAAAYSLGRINASKRLQLEFIEPGMRVLYAGVGRGQDALLAARFGARVTGIDIAPAMLARLARRLEREGLEAELLESDVASHHPDEPYDVVVANYFLNLYDVERAQAMLRMLGDQVRPGGYLACADFARPVGGKLSRLVTEAYYRPVNWIGWALGLAALHPILDYPRLLEPLDFEIVFEQRLPVLFGANPAYVSIVAQRNP